MRTMMAILTFFFAGSALYAQPLSYRVVDVEAGDTLNIRAEPDAAAAIVAELAHDAWPVEIVEHRDGWGRLIGIGDSPGWVSMSYLEEMYRSGIGDGNAPGGLQCVGTEPFWSLTIDADGSGVWADAMSYGEDRPVHVSHSQTADVRPYPYLYEFEGAITGFAVVDAQSCSDGMSDIEYGWRAYVRLRDAEGGRRFVEGCCYTPLPDPAE
jgi:uncharacterized membrane protein